jgi:hypothetical protein
MKLAIIICPTSTGLKEPKNRPVFMKIEIEEAVSFGGNVRTK